MRVGVGGRGGRYRVFGGRVVGPFYDTDETHIISMTIDREGNVIAGGDPKGYVYRISPEGKAFVLYDSGMREIHSVAVAPNGTIYAAAMTGEPSISPVTPAAPAATAGSQQPTVTVTVNAAGPAGPAGPQDIQVVEPLDAV